MRRILTLALLLAVTMQMSAQKVGSKVSKMDWWQQAKFGLFIHWGPYCLYGGVYDGYNQRRGGAEWIMNRCKIPVREYRAKATTFNPTLFNAESIALMAKGAGMKYIVLTTKHHDGFAMFKSNASNFNIVDYTPFGRDVVDELARACRKYDLKLGFYYSHSQDWNNPGGATSRKLMREGWPNPDSTLVDDYTSHHDGAWDPIQTSRSYEDYFHQVSLPQIKELLARYPDVAIFWFDTPTRMSDSLADEVMQLMKEHPQIIVNDRLKRPNYPGDYKTPEGKVPKPEDVDGIYWETCMNIGSSWGYKSWENRWKSTESLIKTLLMCSARGGNLLLNVGPDPTGVVPMEAQSRLDSVGHWIQKYGEMVYGTERSGINPDWGEVIRKDGKRNTTYYLAVYNLPANGQLNLKCGQKAKRVSLVSDGKPLKFSNNQGTITINLPSGHTDGFATLVRVDLSKKLSPVRLTTNSAKYFSIKDEN